MPLAIGTPLPSLEGATAWINGDYESAVMPSSPLLVQFWSLSCPACKYNMPGVLGFLSTYGDYGLRLVSIHMPRGEWDLDIDRVRATAEELQMTGPCAIDNSHVLGRRFQTDRIWPSYFFFDSTGQLRSRAAGRLGLQMAESSLRRILGGELRESKQETQNRGNLYAH